jgi:1,2-phenylacetyl-CoA epoxidase catalytic subunit
MDKLFFMSVRTAKGEEEWSMRAPDIETVVSRLHKNQAEAGDGEQFEVRQIAEIAQLYSPDGKPVGV